MDSISPEILQEIILRALKDDTATTFVTSLPILLDESSSSAEEVELMRLYEIVKGTRRDILSFLQVCKRWQSITIGFPDLWTTIYVTKRTWEVDMWKWYERSRNIPVDVTLDFTDTTGTTTLESDDQLGIDAEIIVHALTAFQYHMHRCRSLSIAVTSSMDIASIAHQFSVMIPATTVAMEQFRFTYLGTEPLGGILSTSSTFFGGLIPSLQRLRLHRVPLTFSCPPFTMNLTVLAIRSSTATSVVWHTLIAVLGVSPRLEMLTLHGISCVDTPATTLGAGRLPMLVYLSLGRLEMDLAVSIIDAIDIYSLDELTLNFDGSNATVLCRRLCAKIAGRPPLLETVRKLTVRGLFAPDNVIYSFVRNMHGLEYLNLRNCWFLFNVLEQVTLDHLERGMNNRLGDAPPRPSLYPSMLCPRLSVLKASGLRGLALGSFLVARYVMGKGLDQVSIHVHDVKELELLVIRNIVEIVRVFHDP